MKKLAQAGSENWCSNALNTCKKLLIGATVSASMVSGVTAAELPIDKSLHLADPSAKVVDPQFKSKKPQYSATLQKIDDELERRSWFGASNELPESSTFIAESVKMDHFADHLYENIGGYVDTFMNAQSGDIIDMNGEKIIYITNKDLEDDSSFEDILQNLDDETLLKNGLPNKAEVIDSIKIGLGGNGMQSAFIESRGLKILSLDKRQFSETLPAESIIAHELGHYAYDGKNSHENEFFSDLLAIKYNIDKGVNPEDAVAQFKEFRDNPETSSYHTNAFEYEVLEALVKENNNIFNELTVSDLNSISNMSNHAGLDIIRNNLKPKMYDSLVDHLMKERPIDINDIGSKAIDDFEIFKIIKGGFNNDKPFKSEDFLAHLEEYGYKERYRDDFDFLSKTILEDHTDRNGNIKEDTLENLKSNDFLTSLLKDKSVIDSYTRDRFNRSLVNNLMNSEESVYGEKLHTLSNDVAHTINVSYNQSEPEPEQDRKRRNKQKPRIGE